MAVTYGLNIENQNAINERAKSKRDGVFSFRGVAYKVKSGAVMALACGGEVLQQHGNFNVKIGSYDIAREQPASALKRIK